MRGPTANIYGSGAIGGVVSFRTKDINDVRASRRTLGRRHDRLLRHQQRTAASARSSAACAPIPNVDIFGGAVYRTQGNYKDGNGTEIGNTGNDIAGGLMKLTVRPARRPRDQVRRRVPGLPVQHRPAQPRPDHDAPRRCGDRGLVGLRVRRQELHRHRDLEIFASPTTCCGTGTPSVYGNRTDNDQIKTYNNRITTGGGVCTLGNPGNNISGCVGDRRGYLLDTIGIDVNNTTRFNVGDWRNALTYGFDAFQDEVNTFDSRGNSNVTTPGGERTVSGGFVQLKKNYSTWLEVVSAIRYDRYDLQLADGVDRRRPLLAEDHGRRHAGGGLHALCQLCRRLSRAVDHGDADLRRPRHRRRPGAVRLSRRHQRPVLLPAQSGLRPEVGKNKEVGVNLKYDNIFTAADSLPRQVQRVPQRRRRLYRSRRLDAGPPIPAVRLVQPVLPVPEHRACPDRGCRERRRCMMRASGSSVSPAMSSAARTLQTNVGLATITAAQGDDHRPACGCSIAR